MTDSPPPNLTLLAAFDLLRNKKPAELTSEEVAGLRARLQVSNPVLFAAVGGPEAVERFLEEAETALEAQAAAAAISPQKPAQATASSRQPRGFRRKIEAISYAVAVVAAAGGLYAFLRDADSKPPATQNTAPSTDDTKSLAAVQPTTATTASTTQETGENSAESPETNKKPAAETPAEEPADPNLWLGWRIHRGDGGVAEQQDEWDRSDPSNPVPAKALRVSGAALRLTRSAAIAVEDKWLMIFAHPTTAAFPAGQITVNIDGQQAAKASIGAGESDWPLYISMEDSGQVKRSLEIVFTPGKPQQQIIFWNARLVGDQIKKPQPESPLIAALRSNDPAIRAQGATAAAQVVDPLVVGALVRAVTDPHRDVRRAAVITLAKYNVPTQAFIVDALVLKLRDADPEIRRLAAQSLMAFNTDSTWVALTQAMTAHTDLQLRLQIAQQLSGRNHPVIRPAFEKLMDSVDDSLRLAAVNSLASLADPGATALLARALSDPEPSVRRTAANFLFNRNDAEAEVATIAALASHPDPLVRRIALARFHSRPSTKAMPAILAAMESADDQLRRLVPQALVRMTSEQAAGLLVPMLQSPDANLRMTAATVLWNRPGSAAEDFMLGAIYPGQESSIRQLAIRRFGTPALVTARVIPPLRDALKDPSATVRNEAVEALRTVRMAQLQYFMEHGKTRAQALDALAAPPWGETFSLMVQMLDDPTPQVRASAAGALRSDPHPDADAIMPRLLSSTDALIRQLAAGRFASFAMTSAKTLDFHKQCLKDPDAAVRASAVSALVHIRGRESAALLATAFDDPAVTVREIVQRARLRNPADVQNDALLPAEAKVVGPQAVPVLVKLLGDPKPSIRQAAALRLSQNPEDAAEQAMLQALRSHSDVDVRRTAAQSLLRKPPTPAVMQIIQELVRDPDAGIRTAALQVLALDPKPEAIAMMTSLLNDPAVMVRMTAATLLSASPSPAADDAVIPLLNHTDWQIRQLAVQRFTRAPSPKAISGLGAAAASPEKEVRVDAIRALGRLNDPAIIPILARAVDDRDDAVRAASLEILRGRAEPACAELMVQLLNSHPRADVRIFAAQKFEAQPNPAAIGPLVTAAKNEDDALRSASLRALGRLAEPAATAAIIEAINDPIPEVRLAAATVLAQRRDDASEAAMITALTTHSDVEVRRLAATRFLQIPNAKAVPALAESLNNVDDQLRQLAVQALQTTPAAAIDPLIAALQDPNDNIRQVALGALVPQTDPKAQAAVTAYKAKLEPAQ